LINSGHLDREQAFHGSARKVQNVQEMFKITNLKPINIQIFAS